MKKILFIFLISSIFSMAYGQGRTATYSLPLWNAGNTLTAGSTTDTSTSNAGINSISLRTDKFFNQYFSKVNDSLRGVKFIRGANGNRFDFNASSGTYLYSDYFYLVPTTAASLNMYPYGTSAGNTAGLVFYELAANGTNYIGLKARDTIASSLIFRLPPADGTTGQSLVTNGSGYLTWATVSGGAVDSNNFAKINGNNSLTGRNTFSDLVTMLDSLLLDPGIATTTNTFIQVGDGKASTNARHLFVIGSLATGTGDRNGGNIYLRGGDNINNGTEGNIILSHDGTNQIGRVNIGRATQPAGLLDVGTGGEFSVGFTGAVTMPTPFTLGATSVTSTGTQLNYLNAATGTTGTTSANLVFSTQPTFTTDIKTPLVIGGTTTTSDLSLQTTSGVGTTGADMHFLVGNNGATEAMTILNSGNVGINTNAPAVAGLHIKGNDTQANLQFETGASYTTMGYFAHYQGATLQLAINRRIDGTFSNTGAAAANINLVGLSDNSYLTFSTATTSNVAPTQRLIIDQDGNIGIGNITASQLFDVNNKFSVNSSGVIAEYNNISTISNGVPTEYAQVNLTAQETDKATTTLYAVPASSAGQYRISWNAKVTTAATTSSILGALTIVYTDPDGVVQTIICAAQNNGGTIGTTETGNTTATVLIGVPLLLNANGSTNITYAFSHTSVGATTMAYNLHIVLERM